MPDQGQDERSAASPSRRKRPPRLVLGPLTGRIYIATRYRERDNGVIETQEKFDVTNDFLALYEEATSKFTYTAEGGHKHG
jgi:hypothetical protein